MTNQNEIKPMRVAIRGEGHNVNAYLAKPDTMVGAVLIAHVNRQLCADYPELFEDFMALLTKVAGLVCESTLGVVPLRVDLTPSPEHEKSGSA